jgi:integrase
LRDLGGKQESLIPPGERRATSDPDIAAVLAARRLKEFEAERRGRIILEIRPRAKLADFARLHLIKKARAGRVTDQWLESTEKHLERATAFFGADRNLESISTTIVQEWTAHLQSMSNGRGGTMSDGNVRHHLNSLSNLFRRAQAENHVPPGYNPVAALMEKPPAHTPQEAKWLEVHDAALLLEAARTYDPKRDDIALPFTYPLIATFLLTGGRAAEVLGLEVEDVSFFRKKVTFRPNGWRRLKTATSHRSVPLWPQLEEILRTYIYGPSAPPGRLLFPSFKTGRERPVRDSRKLLDKVADRAEWKPGEIRSKMFRHTYCAARLQTLDRGEPVSQYTVGKELGHGGESMVRRVYGHLGEARHRSQVVEYRVEQHRERLGERLERLHA